jgi:hypothetical protein
MTTTITSIDRPVPAGDGPVTVVVLKADNTIGHRIRTYDAYDAALRYLERHLPRRKNLDLIDTRNRFVAWEPTTQPAELNETGKAWAARRIERHARRAA